VGTWFYALVVDWILMCTNKRRWMRDFK